MTTKNYNAALPRKILTTMLVLGDMTIEELSAMCEVTKPEDEERLRHILTCLRYKAQIVDNGPVWRLTEHGRDYAEWATAYPQRFRRMRGEEADPKAIHDADVLVANLRQRETSQTTTKPI